MRRGRNRLILRDNGTRKRIGRLEPGESRRFAFRPLALITRSALSQATVEPAHVSCDRVAQAKEDFFTDRNIRQSYRVSMEMDIADVTTVRSEGLDRVNERRATGFSDVQEMDAGFVCRMRHDVRDRL
ncbi:hypothetical protein P350_27665 [Burkholderia cepacia JBK9]|nr:hypothetical protein P350_27665 [Burkholderia cepacia JBK9]